MAIECHTHKGKAAVPDKAEHYNRVTKPQPMPKGSGPSKYQEVHSSGVPGTQQALHTLSLHGSHQNIMQSTLV